LRTADSEIFTFFCLVISHISIVNNPTNSLIYFAACLLGRDTVLFFFLFKKMSQGKGSVFYPATSLEINRHRRWSSH
jgi:hypothetical protein